MTSYTYNRGAFKSSSTSDLASTYCNLVQMELALKEHLGFLNSEGNGGHDVPKLLKEFGNTKVANIAAKGSILSSADKIGNRLTALWFQGLSGSAKPVPRRSYPNMRYVRHSADGWPAPASSDACVKSLKGEVENAMALLKSVGVVF